MRDWLRRRVRAGYERLLSREVDGAPEHVAVIQDGNRRYARERGGEATDGYQAGARTTEEMLDWCADLGVEELTLYAFSTENFERPEEQQEHLFDLLTEKLHEFADADRVHDRRVRVRAIGETDRLPPRVRDAIAYADRRTRGYDGFTLNVALAYGGRAELLGAARDIAHSVHAGDLSPDDVTVDEIQGHLHPDRVRDVDLIIRTGGDERTSNFLPWHANGSEAAVYFCAPYWPEFSKVDFLRGIRTYQAREKSWQRARLERALALVRAFGSAELDDARAIIDRLRTRTAIDLPDEEPAD
ncbi:polyprenyl diphosphate synthase [Salarchaeum sp. JOR-1]|uniref:polyprenyl diphosphate synthase n=1 Tax=Salarchaeum sp. JOR-1 TaxID=2599399 RepID=UPI001198612F|nr:polyprenyl diphosphate synthase [Salarchaeum sp. JOR-1]QDX40653.1 di-trans,poly-cis-decaprenylcistransferase [Salarchaeum sp. JOR-1]